MEEYMIPCMNKQLFGIDCPGCGTQRALALLIKGQFADAFFMFPAIYTSILFFVLLGLHFLDKSRSYEKAVIVTAILNGAIMIIAYIYKIT
jgi:arginine exporter protein ArgO